MILTFTKYWYNEHLTYQNLKQGAINQIFEDDKDSIWIPFVEFRDLEHGDKCLTTDRKEILKIVPNSDLRYEPNSLAERENAFLFSGLENKMVQEKEYSCDFLCEFDYKWYPFDTQVISESNMTPSLNSPDQICPLHFNMSESEVFLRADTIQYSGAEELLQYFFKEINSCDNVEATIFSSKIFLAVKYFLFRQNVIMVEITLGRPLTSSMITTFLPTMMLLVISQISTLLSQSYFDLLIEVNTTVLLVLTT